MMLVLNLESIFAQVFAEIQTEAIARDVLAFANVQSETGSEGPGSLFLADLLRREGFEPVLDEVEPGAPNVYAHVRGNGGGRTLMFNGHTDTIPIGQSDPPAREGDWIVGRGTEDMKGGLVAMVHAAAALRRTGVRLSGDLWLTGVIDHESPKGKKRGPRRLIRHLRDGRMQADGIVIMEGPCAIWSASLGSTIFTVTITSDRGRIHTIKVPYSENPALYAGRLLVEFERLEQDFSRQPPHPLCGNERINVGIVSAGDYFNRLPTPAAIGGTWRWKPGKTHADVKRQLEQICEKLAAESGLHFSVQFEAEREPFETARDHPLVEALVTGGMHATGAAPDVIGMALVGDANLYANDGGVPVAYYGPAHETAHSDHERVSASRLAQCGRVYAAAAMQFCGVSR